MAHDHDHDAPGHDHDAWQLEQTAATWQALLDNGAREGGPLIVDSYFYADAEGTAKALADALAAAGSDVDIEAGKPGGFLRKAKPWEVVSTTTLPAASLAAITGLTGQMITLAHELGVEYDGWGAQIPDA